MLDTETRDVQIAIAGAGLPTSRRSIAAAWGPPVDA